jgi:hypothetical protein
VIAVAERHALMDGLEIGWTASELPWHLVEMMAAHMRRNCHLWLDPQLTPLFAWGPGQMDAERGAAVAGVAWCRPDHKGKPLFAGFDRCRTTHTHTQLHDAM